MSVRLSGTSFDLLIWSIRLVTEPRVIATTALMMRGLML
jgi:hypothetical protein